MINFMLQGDTIEPSNEKCHMITRGGHSIVKLKTMCNVNKSTFSKLHHQNGSKFYQMFFRSRYTWYLLHSIN